MARGVCDGGGGDTAVGSGIKRLKHALKRPKEMGNKAMIVSDSMFICKWKKIFNISQKRAGRASLKVQNGQTYGKGRRAEIIMFSINWRGSPLLYTSTG